MHSAFAARVLFGALLPFVLSNAVFLRHDGLDASVMGAARISNHGVMSPAVGATVLLVSVTEQAEATTRVVAVREDGTFLFENVTRGRFRLRAALPAHLSAEYGANEPEEVGRPIVVGEAGDIRGLDLVLFAGGVVAGAVYDPDGAPARGIAVSALRERHLASGLKQWSTAGRAITDDRGTYRIFGLPPSVYVVAAAGRQGGGADGASTTFYPAAPDISTAQTLLLEAGGARNGVDVSLRRPGTGSLEIDPPTLAGGVAPNAFVLSISPLDDSSVGLSRRLINVNGSHRVALRGLTAGVYRLNALARGEDPGNYKWHAEGTASVADGTTRESGLQWRLTSKVTGQIRPLAGELPRALRVSLVSRRTDSALEPGEFNARSEDDGHFTMAGVFPGDYAIVVSYGTSGPRWPLLVASPQGQPTWAALQVREDDIVGVQLLFERPARFSGSLIGPHDRAATSCSVVLLPSERHAVDGWAVAYVGRPADDGSFSVTGLIPGTFDIAIVGTLVPDDLNNPQKRQLWLEHRVGRVTLRAGEEGTRQLRVSVSPEPGAGSLGTPAIGISCQ